jgi:non-ribosomal peptide synthetase component E (peptide arylation enzyme)
MDEAGYLTITGRLKDIIIRGGENIAVAEVESILLEIPGVLEAAVVGIPDDRFGERVHACVVRTSGAPPVELGAVRRHFEQRGVARFKVPESVSEISSLPRNSLGKVQKHILRGLFCAV